jgi:hypothetical protein
MKLREIAAKIQAHLNRFAADPKTATTQNFLCLDPMIGEP